MDYGISKSLIPAIRIIRVAITHSIVVDYREIVYIDMGREKEGLLAQTGWAAARFAAIDNGFDHSCSDTTKKVLGNAAPTTAIEHLTHNHTLA